jgi:hypothetical protein
MNKSNLLLATEVQRLKLRIMGTGGFSLAVKETGISRWRLSRIANSWVQPTERELEALRRYFARKTKFCGQAE